MITAYVRRSLLVVVATDIWDLRIMDHQPRSSSLRLSIRHDGDERDVDIRLTLRSLGLVIWLGIGIVLLYEIICTVALLIQTRIAASAIMAGQQNRGIMIDFAATPSVPLYLSCIWGLSTAYAIFYSFEIIFLYINDRWLQLLPVQLLFTATDLYVWIWMVGRIKYRFWGKASSYAKACIFIKFCHVVFNILVEKKIWVLRNWLFCSEDLACLAMAQEIFGFSLLKMRKEMSVLGIGLLISATVFSTATRIT